MPLVGEIGLKILLQQLRELVYSICGIPEVGVAPVNKPFLEINETQAQCCLTCELELMFGMTSSQKNKTLQMVRFKKTFTLI